MVRWPIQIAYLVMVLATLAYIAYRARRNRRYLVDWAYIISWLVGQVVFGVILVARVITSMGEPPLSDIFILLGNISSLWSIVAIFITVHTRFSDGN